MKGAETNVIGASLFQFYKPADDVNNIKAAENLLYGALGDHCSLYPIGLRLRRIADGDAHCEYKTSGFWPILNSVPPTWFSGFLNIFPK